MAASRRHPALHAMFGSKNFIGLRVAEGFALEATTVEAVVIAKA